MDSEEFAIYGGFATAYDLFMDNIPYDDWHQYLRGLLQEQGVSRGIVADLACGTGEMTRRLAQDGYDMIGIDLSPEMLEIAREKCSPEILFLQQDLREMELYGTVAACVCVCDGLNYILEEDQLTEVFRKVNNYLDPGGAFIFDMKTRYFYEEVLGDRVITENREDASFIWQNEFHPENAVNEYLLTVYQQEPGEDEDLFRRCDELHRQRAYSVEQVREMLEAAGMEFVAVYDAFTKEAPHAGSERLYFVAREHYQEGRLLSAGSMLGCMMKGEKDKLTLQIECGGPIGGITVTADSAARVKGYVNHPAVILPANSQGKLDVAGAIGPGFLNVIRDIGMKEPYNGQVMLQSGEIAEDLTYYYATSEQVPSAVGLGVLMNHDNHVAQAGGFIIQVMPFAQDEVIDVVERNIAKIHSVTDMLEQGMTPEDILRDLMGDLDVEITDTMDTGYVCDCSRERVSRALASISRQDIQSMIDDGEKIVVNCQFCGEHYEFTPAQLQE